MDEHQKRKLTVDVADDATANAAAAAAAASRILNDLIYSNIPAGSILSR